MKNVNAVAHYYLIKVKNSQRDVIEHLMWQDMSFEIRCKYDWYFRYRAALLQVKYPRFEVNCQWGNHDPNPKTLKHIISNRIKAQKSKITEYQNKLNAYVNDWNSLFPIAEDPTYLKALDSIEKRKIALVELQKMITE